MVDTPDFTLLEPPAGGTITAADGVLDVPEDPVIPIIVGDGIGPDIMNAALPVLETAVEVAYGGDRKPVWFEVPAGEGSHKKHGEYLPQDTIDAIAHYKVALKGPLTTPVGKGIRSLNVTLRQVLDLYACVRPVYWVEGVPSPIHHPKDVDMVIFRENTEDVYAGIEWEAGSAEVEKVKAFLEEMGVADKLHDGPIGIGIKPITEFGTKRLVRKAIEYAIEHERASVTLVHKGNIMKFTEGAFRDWGYEVAKDEFGDRTITEMQLWDDHDGEVPAGKIVIKDRIADNMLQQLTTRTAEYDVLALPNLNGDYLSDAAAGLIGGLGMAPGANVSGDTGLFEATHGTAPKYAGQDKVNPSSVILSGAFMLEHMGWKEAGKLVKDGIRAAVQAKEVTYDLARQMEPTVEPIACSAFGEAIQKHMRRIGA